MRSAPHRQGWFDCPSDSSRPTSFLPTSYKHWTMSMPPVTPEHPRTFTTDHLPIATASLRNTPAVLSSLLANAPETLLYSREAPDAWTPVQVVEHLIVAERKAWIPRVRRILSGEQQLPPF